MLVEGIDKIGLTQYNYLREVRLEHPEYVYFFNYCNIGIEIIRNKKRLSSETVKSDNGYYFHVVVYNFKPDFDNLKLIYRYEIQNFKNDKWNRKFTCGDFQTIEGALTCFGFLVRQFTNTITGVLF